jgi:ATP-dependent phosphofructokinase / diphosphate-dependent phosphofructokinase
MTGQGSIGIVVSGGPAPGINGVISATVYAAQNEGFTVKGLYNGFKGISTGESDVIVDLNPNTIPGGIYKTGGSILGTSRFNPLSKPETFSVFVERLAAHRIDKLIVIGGEGSAWVSHQLSVKLPELRIVHVPKTIDNDLILPNNYSSFGFQTARSVGTEILNTLKVDAKTCQRWFLVTSMGRKAGFLALGLGIASGATLTLIPEEFNDKPRPSPRDIADIILKTIKRRHAMGRSYGVIILAEGIVDVLDPESSEELANIPRDELGRVRYNMLEIGDVVAPPLRDLCKQHGLNVKINTKNIGYELRCHRPVSFDVEYTTFLGYGAVQLLKQGLSGVMVVRDYDRLDYRYLSDMILEDGKISSRTVDLDSDYYRVASSFMIR